MHKVSRLTIPSLRLLTPLQLAKLDNLAVYFDTDVQSLAGLSYEAAVDRFSSMVPYLRFSMITGVMTSFCSDRTRRVPSGPPIYSEASLWGRTGETDWYYEGAGGFNRMIGPLEAQCNER